MSTSARILPHYTYEDYQHWKDQWEIIDGIPYAMSPAPMPYHQLLANNLGTLFNNALKGNRCRCRVYQPIDYLLSEDTVVNPDLLIVCRPILKKYLDFPPALVAEIMSPSTVLKDRHTKFELYQNAGVKYYLIIDPDEKTIEKFILSEENSYIRNEDIRSFDLLIDCTIDVDLTTIWE